MTATFLIEVETEGSTDFIGISADLQDALDRGFSMRVLSVKPWARQTTAPLTALPNGQPIQPTPPL